MPIRTIKKAKSTMTCRNCKGNVAGGASKCQNCNSTDLAKSLVLIRKSEATGEDAGLSDADLETASEKSESEDVEDIEEDDEVEDLSEEDFEPADEEDESDDDEDSEDDEEEDDEEEEEPQVTKRVVRRRAVSKSVSSDEILADIALVALAAVDDISKSLDSDEDEKDEDYEEAMSSLNNAMDAVFEAGADGKSISKEDKAAKLARLKAKLASLKAKLGGGSDDDDDVEKSDNDDIFAGLTPQAAEIVRKSQELIEKNTNDQFTTIAKSYGELPTSSEELGKALRFLSENDEALYATITKALAGAANAVADSAIFKSFGTQRGGEEHQGQTLEAITKSFQEQDKTLTPEQALVKAMTERPDLYKQSLLG